MRLPIYLARTILIIFPGVVSITSCEKTSDKTEKQQTSFDTEYYEMDFILMKNSQTGFHIFAEEIFSNEFNAILNITGISAENVNQVLIKEANISLLEPENHPDFNMLKFIELTVYTDSLGDEKIAWSDPVPADKSDVPLDLADENMLSYFREDKFILTVQGYLKERVYENIKLHAKIKFEVKGEF